MAFHPRLLTTTFSLRCALQVTACQQEEQPSAVSNFTAEGPFALVTPFLRLDAQLPTDPAVALEPTNFALPSVQPEADWPPAEGSVVHPIYIHACQQLRVIEHAAANARSRSRAARPELPELPIALTAPCHVALLTGTNSATVFALIAPIWIPRALLRRDPLHVTR